MSLPTAPWRNHHAPCSGATLSREGVAPRGPCVQRMLTEKWSGENRTNRTAGYGPGLYIHKIIWGDNVICRSVPVVRFLAQSRKPDPHAQGGSGLRDYLGVLGLRNRGLQPPQPPPPPPPGSAPVLIAFLMPHCPVTVVQRYRDGVCSLLFHLFFITCHPYIPLHLE